MALSASDRLLVLFDQSDGLINRGLTVETFFRRPFDPAIVDRGCGVNPAGQFGLVQFDEGVAFGGIASDLVTVAHDGACVFGHRLACVTV